MNMDFMSDFILEDWESEEDGNVKLNGLTNEEWINLYLLFIKKKLNEKLKNKRFYSIIESSWS